MGVRGDPDATGPVVGVDGSPAAETALDAAFERASRAELPLVVAHAVRESHWRPPVPVAWPSTSRNDGGATRRRTSAGPKALRRLLPEALAGRSEEHPDGVVQRFAPLNEPVRALFSHAEQAVVVGAPGRGGFTGWVLASPPI